MPGLFPELDTLEKDDEFAPPKPNGADSLFPELEASQTKPEIAQQQPEQKTQSLFPELGEGPSVTDMVRQALPAPFQSVADILAKPKSDKPALNELQTNMMEMIQPGVNPVAGALMNTDIGKRAASAMAAGGLGTAANMAAAIPAAEQFIRKKQGFASQYGQKAADVVGEISQKLMPEDPNFFDHTASGLASMAMFALPGTGVASGMSRVAQMGNIAAKLAPAIGSGISAILEAGTEAGGVYQDQIKKGLSPELAAKSAFDNFWKNAILVGVTNRFGIFGEKFKGLQKALVSAPVEGIQEAGQSILASLSKVDPETGEHEPINWEDVLTSAGVGAVIGGGTGPLIDVSPTEKQIPRRTIIDENTIGPKTSELLLKKFPQLYEGIINKEIDLPQEQVSDLLFKSAVAGEEVLLKGGTPEEANQAATEAFIKEATPLVNQAQEQEAATPPKKELPPMEEILQKFDSPETAIDKKPQPIFGLKPDVAALQEGRLVESEASKNQPTPRVGITPEIRLAQAKEAAQEVLRANKIDDRVLINLVDQIAVDPVAFKEGYGTEYKQDTFDILGATYPAQAKSRIQAVIELAQGATESTGRHEAFHAVSNILLEENEKSIITKKYGDMEKAADAFGEYRLNQKSTGDSVIDRVFQRITEFLEKFSNYLTENNFTTADELFQKIEQGKFSERAGRIDGEGTTQYSARKSLFSAKPIYDYETGFSDDKAVSLREEKQDELPFYQSSSETSPVSPATGKVISGQPPVRGPRPVQNSSFEVRFKENGFFVVPNQKVRNPADLAYAFKSLKDETQENFFLGAIKNGRIVGIEHLGFGTVDQVATYPFETLSLLDQKNADEFFIIHNHPSGFTAPSDADKMLTAVLRRSLERSGVKLAGHVIIDTEKFGFIDRYGNSSQHTHQEYKRTKKIPVLRKYTEWLKSKQDALSGPVVTSSKSAYEIGKGILTGKDEGIVHFLNTQNVLLNSVIIPHEQFTSGIIQKLAARYRAPGVLFVNSNLTNQQILSIKSELSDTSINLLDDISLSDNNTQFVSRREQGLYEPKVQYSAQPKEQNAPIFYSQLQNTLEKKLPGRAMPDQIKNILNSQEVKREEVEWSGINEWLADKKGSVTKEEVLNFIKENQVQIKEVTKGGKVTPEMTQRINQLERFKQKGAILPEEEAELERLRSEGQTPTKFERYVLPGGENYRELLLTLPRSEKSLPTGWTVKENQNKKQWEVFKSDGSYVISGDTKQSAIDWAMKSTMEKTGEFLSSHFSEPNILAHVRFNDRTDADGKKVLFIEEIQSDWHQKGREKGYQEPKLEVKPSESGFGIFAADKRIGYFNTEAEAKKALTLPFYKEEASKSSSAGVPNAPFKKTWHELSLKRMLRYAAENGYDSIAWTTGTQQAERYDLSKQINSVWYQEVEGADPREFRISVFDKGDNNVLDKTVEIGQLPDLVGKDVADRIAKGEGKDKDVMNPSGVPSDGKSLEGLDLKVGGEGMKGFYDSIIPSFINKYTKKWGGKVGQSFIETPTIPGHANMNDRGIVGEDTEDIPGESIKVNSLDLTPDMRESVLKSGQPLYSAKVKDPNDKNNIPKDVYAQNRAIEKQVPFMRNVSDLGQIVKDTLKVTMVPISTRLESINPVLKMALRRHEYNLGQQITKDLKTADTFFKKIHSVMSKDDLIDFDLARKNGDAEMLQRMIIKYRIGSEYYQLRKMLNDSYNRAKAVNFDLGYREHYHPRALKDKKGFLEYLQKGDDWSILREAIAEKEKALNRMMTVEEKADFLNSMIRGYGRGKITLSETGQMKARRIEFVDAAMNQFFYDSDAALIQYINQVNNAIEARKFFGKQAAISEGNDFGVSSKQLDVDNSVGAYTTELLLKGKIQPSQEKELADIIHARFAPAKMGPFWSTYRDVSYLDTMGSVISAVTQLGDLGISLYRSNPVTLGKNIGKSFVNKSDIKMADLGVDKIAEEFSDPRKLQKLVNRTFKMTGMEKMDRLGKETYVNSVIDDMRRRAKNPNADLMRRLLRVFESRAEVDAVIEDLKSGAISDDIKYLAFNELLDLQPIAKSEMPEKYHSSGNGRILYMLKSFQLKQLDVFRKEIALNLADKSAAGRAKGVTNLMYLAAAVMAANAGADVIKNIMLNRPTYLSDVVADNLFRLALISKYTVYSARQEGAGTAAIKTIAPPAKLITSVYKDFINYNPDKTGINKFQGNLWKGKPLETTASIPVVGKIYYWWLGGGVEKTEHTRKRMARKARKNR